jgi:hypothetical protein
MQCSTIVRLFESVRTPDELLWAASRIVLDQAETIPFQQFAQNEITPRIGISLSYNSPAVQPSPSGLEVRLEKLISLVN